MKDKPYIQLLSDLEPDRWDVYPRPQLKREGWLNLNGIWDIRERDTVKQIRVPFPPQAELSGYETPSVLSVPEELLYEKKFILPKNFRKRKTDRILLHFGAADQIADVFVNGKPAIHHEGGYLPFTVDITKLLRPDGESNLLNVLCIDRLEHRYPWGKQKKERGGMWYTPVSGLWQTVWLECVPQTYIDAISVELLADPQEELPQEQANIAVKLSLCGADRTQTSRKKTISYCIQTPTGTLQGQAELKEEGMTLTIPSPRYWQPEDPYLYPMQISCGDDHIETYFALRTISIRRIGDYRRVCLNGKPILLKGVLDQGYFCDGLFLPANPTGYEQDIRRMKELGFNLLRKHIKLEPERFYYDCDRLGMLVMQDMINNGSYSFLADTALPTLGIRIRPERKYQKGLPVEKERQMIFLQHSRAIIDQLKNHPSVIAYTVFNEGWGQFASDRVGDELRACDPSRLFDYTSGWFSGKNSDFTSVHNYFHPCVLRQKEKALLLSECGGYSWMIPDHSYSVKSYGYGKAADRESLMKRIRTLYQTMIYPSIKEGLCGYIYTQVSDIEEEVNGFWTYDRKICKVDAEEMRKLNEEAELSI